MWNFQDTFETRKRPSIIVYSICMAVLLKESYENIKSIIFQSHVTKF